MNKLFLFLLCDMESSMGSLAYQDTSFIKGVGFQVAFHVLYHVLLAAVIA